MTKHKAEAQKWLGYLRGGTDMYDAFIGYLRRDVENGGLSLADIGTAEEGIEELRVKGCKIGAQKWLGYLRDGSDQYDAFIGYVREEISKGNLLLADISTSEEEIEELRIKGCKTGAQKWLGYLRNGTSQYASMIEDLRQEVENGGLSLADVGTSEKEINSFGQIPA